ncbi:hypothetical protein BBJ28_00013479 [Nothophytophthora sp. Chile5]|nr:hypothetical protein BBJ28_00013479 [Nothophytophthora sp. Chile5]
MPKADDTTQLAAAVRAVQAGELSLRKAAAQFGVSRGRLQRRVTGEVALLARNGPKPTLSAAEEQRVLAAVEQQPPSERSVEHIQQLVLHVAGDRALPEGFPSRRYVSRLMERQRAAAPAEEREDDPDDQLEAFKASTHLKYVVTCRETFESAFFPLSGPEIAALEANGNTSEHWELVLKTSEHEPLRTNRIRGCSFHEKVVLGRFTGDAHDVDGVPFAPGVYNSALSNVVVLDDALVLDTLVLRNVVLDERACVIKCGSVTCSASASATCGNGNVLHVGVETGGRDLCVVADMPFACEDPELIGEAEVGVAVDLMIVCVCRGDSEFLKAYQAAVDAYVVAIQAPMVIVARNARVRGCSRVEGSFVGEHALLEDCDVANSTILSTAEEPSVVQTKSIVRDSIVQWNSTVEALSVVENAFLCDSSHVERHGVVMNSVIGPNTSVAEGEVTSSFVGPFVGFHHQALLIASIWPQGKGNVGYGANVGSNHTLKAPDQELFPGEGVFFGLGCNVKFPSNFVKAPYSVIATAVNTLPQLVAMPFSLINTPGHVVSSLSPAINEISPGWVLASSVFTVLRNEQKFRSRNKSKRTQIESAIFRPEIVHSLYELATLAGEVSPETRIHQCLSDLVEMKAAVAKKAADGKARDDARGQRIIPDYSDVHKPAASEEVVLQAQRFARRL